MDVADTFAWRLGAAMLAALAVAATACGADAHKESAAKPVEAKPQMARDLGNGRCIGINSNGQVVGIDDTTTFLIDANGERTELPSPDEQTMVVGIGIDERGRVVGYSDGPDGCKAVAVEHGTWASIGAPGPRDEAMTVSADGAIGGAFYPSEDRPRGFVVRAGNAIEFDWPKGGSAVYAASGARKIAGILETADGETHGFSAGSALRDIGTLGGKGSAALAINARGDVAGTAEAADGSRHAFLLKAGTSELIDLGLPGDAVWSDARGIDDAGRAAGNSENANGDAQAWLFEANKKPVALRALDADGQSYFGLHVAGMSPDGRIIGWGVPRTAKDGAPVHCLLWSSR
jgi:probable HAF family extracellular repeat protein